MSLHKEGTSIKYIHWFFLLIVLALILVVFNKHKPAISQQAVPILVYHLIENYHGKGDQSLYVTPQNFEKQLLYLRKNGFTPLTFEDWNQINHVKKPILITFDDAYKDNTNMWSIFRNVETSRFQPKATIFVILDDIGRPNHLNKKDIQAMAKSKFFSIQSHTVTHPNLRQSKDLDFELGTSKKGLEQITHKQIIAVSYPYGDFDENVITTAAKYYKFGVTTMPGFYIKLGKPNETLLLPRIYIKYSTTIKEFAELVNS